MIHHSEQAVVDTLNERLEELKKAARNYQKYTVDSQGEFEQHYKKIGNIAKQYNSQITPSKDDVLSLSTVIHEWVSLFEFISKTKLGQYGEFTTFLTKSWDEYNEKMNNFTKKITDFNYQNVRTLAQVRTNCKKLKEKYEKLNKEIEQNLNSSKKSQSDAQTGFNVAISAKNDGKLKELVKQIEQSEQQYKELSEQADVKTKEFEQGLESSHIQLVQVQSDQYKAYVCSAEKAIELAMKQDQHRLLANNWIKGHIDERSDKIVNIGVMDSEQEDRIISQKYEQDNQSRYLDIMSRIIDQQPVSDQEYIVFPDILHKQVEGQLQIINDRIKNLKCLAGYMGEIAQSMESIHKTLQKYVKSVLATLQDKPNEKEKSLFLRKIQLIQELMISHHDGYCKRFYLQFQFFQLKQASLEQMVKDQKSHEKSFQNMYSKMLQDFKTIKQSMNDNEQKPQLKDTYLQQLKKSIKEGAMIIKYSLEQVRTQENQRAQQVAQIVKQLLANYVGFIEENITSTKQQEEILNQKFDQIGKDPQNNNQISLKCEHVEFKFIKLFELTDEIKSRIEESSIQAIEEDESEINLEEGSVKVSQRLLEQFKVQEGEKCLSSYACAFDNKILLQGRMYIFTNRICFHSYFNPKTLFGTTVLVIPASDIQQVKKVKAYLVDAAIEFKTTKGVITFASFMNRDHTMQQLKLVKGLLDCIVEEKHGESEQDKNAVVMPFKQEIDQTTIQQQPLQIVLPPINTGQSSQSQAPASPIEIINKQSDIPQVTAQVASEVQKIVQQQQLEQQPQPQQQTQPQPQTSPQPAKQSQNDTNIDLLQLEMKTNKDIRYMNQPNITKFTQEFPISVVQFTNQFLLDKQYGGYQSFTHFQMVTLQKDQEIMYETYSPVPEWGSKSNRNITYVHPAKQRQAFQPATTTCATVERLYLFNQNEVLNEKEVSFSKIPYGDHFTCRVYLYLTSIPTGCKLEYGYYIHFIKNTMFKGKIEAGSKSENTDLWETGLKPLYFSEIAKLSTVQPPPQEQQPIAQPVVEQIVEDNQGDLYQQIMLIDKNKRFMQSPLNLRFSQEFDITVEEFTHHLLMDTPFNGCVGFFHHLQLNICKDKEVVFNKYEPTPVWGKSSKRIVKFVHPVKDKQMFAPDSATCSTEDTLYLFNHKEVLQEKEVSFSKIPYADHFVCRVYYHLTATPNGCKLDYGFYIHFMKSTVWKSKIETSSKLENTEFWEKQLKIAYLNEQQRIIGLRNTSKDIIQDQSIYESIMEQSEDKVIPNTVQTTYRTLTGSTNSFDSQPSNQVQSNVNLEEKLNNMNKLLRILILLVGLNLVATILK